jgi:predicted Zn-ribbon and HTH transcriptional regulator
MADDEDPSASVDPDYKRVRVLGGDGDAYARGLVQPTTVTETKPCFLCRSFEKPELSKILQHMLSRGCIALPDGRVQSDRPRRCRGCGCTIDPMEAQKDRCPTCGSGDLEGKPLVIDPRNYGWCRKDTVPTELDATCPEWVQKRIRSEM